MKWYPIQDGPSVPWDYMAPHEAIAKRNHSGQSLARLAERGGLGAAEAEAVVDGLSWSVVGRDPELYRQRWFARAERVNRDWSNDKEQPLKCGIEGQQLVIRIGLATLQHAAEHCPKFYDDGTSPGEPPYEKVVNAEELGRDVVSAMTHEQEDGSSPLSKLFDQAFVRARDDGSLAFADE